MEELGVAAPEATDFASTAVCAAPSAVASESDSKEEEPAGEEGATDASSESDDVSDEEVAGGDGDTYEVERILNSRKTKKGEEFLIKWKGWTPKWNTWEPRANILDQSLIQAYEEETAQQGASPEKKRSKAASTNSSPELLHEFNTFWFAKWTMREIGKAACVHKGKFSQWVNNKLASAVSIRNLESKLSAWSKETRQKIERGESTGLPPPSAERQKSGRGRAGGGRGKGGLRAGRPAGGLKQESIVQAPAAAVAEVAGSGELAEMEVEVDDDDDESDGEGDHRIDKLVRGMRHCGRRWILVKWATYGHEGNTWEKRRNLHPEAVEDFDAFEKVPFVLSELLELTPYASRELLDKVGMLPASVRDVEPEELPGDEENGATSPRAITQEGDVKEESDVRDEGDKADEENEGGETVGTIEKEGERKKESHDNEQSGGKEADNVKAQASDVGVNQGGLVPVAPEVGVTPLDGSDVKVDTASEAAGQAGDHAQASGVLTQRRRRSKLSEAPRPFASEALEPLRADLRAHQLPEEPSLGLLHTAARRLHFSLSLPLSTPLTVAVSPTNGGEGGAVCAAVSAPREDRRVRVTFVVPRETDGRAATEGAGGSSVLDDDAHEDLVLNLPKKAQFATDSDSEAEIEMIGRPPATAAETLRSSGSCAQATTETARAAHESSELEKGHREAPWLGWCEELQEAVNRFDAAINTRRLRGVDVALCCSRESASGPCPPSLLQVLVAALAARNHVTAEVAPLQRKLARDNEGTPTMLCTDRWNENKRSGRAARKVVEISDSDSGSDDDTPGPAKKYGDKCIPFGQVVAASGCSVRVTVSCAAGLAAVLPIWGVRMRGDADWAVRALYPENVLVLREGERALVQAKLSDADGRGVPSAERLLRAVVLATPAIGPELMKSVDVQRDGAIDPAQQGRTPPIVLQKKELNRFLERIVEHRQRQEKRAARLEQEAIDAELQAADQLDQSAVIAPGTKRKSRLAAEEANKQEEWDTFLEGESSDESYQGDDGESEGSSLSDMGGDEELLSASDDEGEASEENQAGGQSKRMRRSKREAAKAGREAMRGEIERLQSQTEAASSGAAAGWPGTDYDEDEGEDEDYVAGAADESNDDTQDDSDSGEEGEEADESDEDEGEEAMEVGLSHSGSEDTEMEEVEGEDQPRRRKKRSRASAQAAMSGIHDTKFDEFLGEMSSDDESYKSGHESESDGGTGSDASGSDGEHEGSGKKPRAGRPTRKSHSPLRGGSSSSKRPKAVAQQSEELLAEFEKEWLTKYSQDTICRHAGVNRGKLSNWLNGRVGGPVACQTLEEKLRIWSATMRAKLERGEETGLPEEMGRKRARKPRTPLVQEQNKEDSVSKRIEDGFLACTEVVGATEARSEKSVASDVRGTRSSPGASQSSVNSTPSKKKKPKVLFPTGCNLAIISGPHEGHSGKFIRSGAGFLTLQLANGALAHVRQTQVAQIAELASGEALQAHGGKPQVSGEDPTGNSLPLPTTNSQLTATVLACRLGKQLLRDHEDQAIVENNDSWLLGRNDIGPHTPASVPVTPEADAADRCA